MWVRQISVQNYMNLWRCPKQSEQRTDFKWSCGAHWDLIFPPSGYLSVRTFQKHGTATERNYTFGKPKTICRVFICLEASPKTLNQVFQASCRVSESNTQYVVVSLLVTTELLCREAGNAWHWPFYSLNNWVLKLTLFNGQHRSLVWGAGTGSDNVKLFSNSWWSGLFLISIYFPYKIYIIV